MVVCKNVPQLFPLKCIVEIGKELICMALLSHELLRSLVSALLHAIGSRLVGDKPAPVCAECPPPPTCPDCNLQFVVGIVVGLLAGLVLGFACWVGTLVRSTSREETESTRLGLRSAAETSIGPRQAVEEPAPVSDVGLPVRPPPRRRGGGKLVVAA